MHTKRLTLPDGKRVLLNKHDYAHVCAYSWHWSKAGVRRVEPGVGETYLHRQLMQAEPRQQVRFRNGDMLDCRRANLKLVGSRPAPIAPYDKVAMIPTNEGEVVTFDSDDFDRVNAHLWLIQDGIPSARIDGRCVPLRRFLLDVPAWIKISHKDGNTLNCRRSNLIINHGSGYRAVHYRARLERASA